MGIRAQAGFLKNAVENVPYRLSDCLTDGSGDGVTYFSAQAIKGMAEASDWSHQGPARRGKERRKRRHVISFSGSQKNWNGSMVDLQLAQGSHGGLNGVGLAFVVP
jgi:hypothetical protein